jgi:Lon protease-like protein
MPDEMPVFPLPGTVFFPRTSLPLHVFEPRYRQMVEDVLRRGRWIAVALLKPAAAESEDPPPFHDVAVAGFLMRSTRLPDGRFHVTLEGRGRVRLEEIPSDRLYRMVRAVPLPETPGWLTGNEGTARLKEVLRLATQLRLLSAGDLPESLLPRGAQRRGALLNLIATSVIAEPRERQAMLEADFDERSQRVLRQLEFSRHLLSSIARRPRPEDPRVN